MVYVGGRQVVRWIIVGVNQLARYEYLEPWETRGSGGGGVSGR